MLADDKTSTYSMSASQARYHLAKIKSMMSLLVSSTIPVQTHLSADSPLDCCMLFAKGQHEHAMHLLAFIAAQEQQRRADN